MSLNVLSLFSGIGGIELGLERAGMTVVGQVEIDDYCRRVLAKHWPDVPRHDDVRTAADWWLSEERPAVDVICGGFPCQDISAAGRRAGIIDGERSSLWTYLARTVRVLRPRYVLVENVAAILVRGLDVVAADLAEIGYDLRWDCVPAASVGAPHRRDRWFGVAYPDDAEVRARESGPRRARADAGRLETVRASGRGRRDAGSGNLADSEGNGRGQGRTWRPVSGGSYWATVWPQALADADREGSQGGGLRRATSERGRAWATEPDVGRVADGIPARVDRLRALGNAVVPQVAEHVGRLIVEHAAAVAA
jgi:DNA (cytosine-5)-methyltransferase 1